PPDTLNSADPSFPGFAITGSQNSVRVNWTTALRSTLSPNMVNEVHGGYTNSFVTFFPEITGDAYSSAALGNTGPFSLSLSGSNGNLGTTLTNPNPSRNNQGRENPTITVEYVRHPDRRSGARHVQRGEFPWRVDDADQRRA